MEFLKEIERLHPAAFLPLAICAGVGIRKAVQYLKEPSETVNVIKGLAGLYLFTGAIVVAQGIIKGKAFGSRGLLNDSIPLTAVFNAVTPFFWPLIVWPKPIGNALLNVALCVCPPQLNLYSGRH